MVKLFTLCAFAFLFCGCSTLTELKFIYPFESLHKIDFTPYTSKGFLITPEKYNGDYESVGLINFTAMPGAQYKLAGSRFVPDYTGTSNIPRYVQYFDWVIDSISFDKVLTKAYEVCKNMGADALVNFNYEAVNYPYYNIKNPVTITGYKIYGFAIKRKIK